MLAANQAPVQQVLVFVFEWVCLLFPSPLFTESSVWLDNKPLYGRMHPFLSPKSVVNSVGVNKVKRWKRSVINSESEIPNMRIFYLFQFPSKGEVVKREYTETGLIPKRSSRPVTNAELRRDIGQFHCLSELKKFAGWQEILSSVMPYWRVLFLYRCASAL